MYNEDMLTDQSMRTLAAELIREKILAATEEEVPYSVAVEIEEFVEKEIYADPGHVLVERDTQKGIRDRQAWRTVEADQYAGAARYGASVRDESVFGGVGQGTGRLARRRTHAHGARLLAILLCCLLNNRRSASPDCPTTSSRTGRVAGCAGTRRTGQTKSDIRFVSVQRLLRRGAITNLSKMLGRMHPADAARRHRPSQFPRKKNEKSLSWFAAKPSADKY